ncbi:MAG: PLP-dependent aspartate aminotransferase family protein [Carnobacterium sp.]
MKFDTKLLHGYPVIDKMTGAASIPKYQASTFHQSEFPNKQQYTYTRFGNPTIEAAEQAIAGLEEAKYGVAFSSGVAAITATLFLLKSGDHIVLGKNIYGGTFQLVTAMLKKFNIEYTFVDETDIGEWKSAVKENTKMFYLESPSNPLLTITDLAEIAKIAKGHEILTACDNTFMTPYYQNPIKLGVDIVIHSATKFLGGHSDIVMGLVATNDSHLYEGLRTNQKIIGSIPGVEESWLMLRGIKTLSVRMDKASKNALDIAHFLSRHSAVKKVFYPSLDEHEGNRIHEKQSKSGGAILSFELHSEESVNKLFNNAKIPIVAVSLGGVESILSYPWTMSHACMSEKERFEMGVTPTVVRLSVGIENSEDLINDLKLSLE